MSLDVKWIHGAPSEKDTPIQVHHYDENTVILRQSKATNYEAPFIFLLFGASRALLLDTGATEDPAVFPLRATVDKLFAERHPPDGYELVVAHTHGHGDHVAGDGQFADRPHTAVVSKEAEAVQEYFGFESWPAEIVPFDLGGRVLEVIGSPGHQKAAITIYDPATGILFTGDTIMPGRLYANDYPVFLETLDRIVDFSKTKPISLVLGCHVEMTRKAGRDYPLGCSYQPRERPLEFLPGRLEVIRDAAKSVAGKQGRHVFADFIIYNTPGQADWELMLAQGKRHMRLNKLRRGFRAATKRLAEGR